MQANDYDEFAQMLDDCYDLIGSGTNKVISGGAKSMFFASLAPYSLVTVRAALGAHCVDKMRGRFTPKPADIIDQIESSAANDGRPGPEEAWAIALKSNNQAVSVTLTAEIAEALDICLPVLESSGAISARKSFLEAYARILENARAERRPVQKWLSLGWDKTGHAEEIKKAVTSGLLCASAIPALMQGPDDEPSPGTKARAQLDGIRQMLADGTDAKEQARLKAVEDSRFTGEEFKRRLNKMVAQYLAGGAST